MATIRHAYMLQKLALVMQVAWVTAVTGVTGVTGVTVELLWSEMVLLSLVEYLV